MLAAAYSFYKAHRHFENQGDKVSVLCCLGVYYTSMTAEVTAGQLLEDIKT